MNTQFTSVSFSTQPLNERAYELKLHFKSQDSSFVRTFTFLETSPTKGRVQDIFTKNGVCQSFNPASPFSKREIKEAKAALPLVDLSLQTVAVFDLNDSEKRYLNGDVIQSAEQSVISLFTNAKIKALIPAQFILCEGSLKADILKSLSEREVEYLNSREAAQSFCECAEYFMNGMKLGGSPKELDIQKYFKALGKESFNPVKTSTTFYPEQYKEIYAPTSQFANTLIPVFSLTGNYSMTSKITTLHVERKK